MSKTETHPGLIVSRGEIKEILGGNLSKQAISKITERADFPAPICSIRGGTAPLFWRREVEAFARMRNGDEG